MGFIPQLIPVFPGNLTNTDRFSLCCCLLFFIISPELFLSARVLDASRWQALGTQLGADFPQPVIKSDISSFPPGPAWAARLSAVISLLPTEDPVTVHPARPWASPVGHGCGGARPERGPWVLGGRCSYLIAFQFIRRQTGHFVLPRP